MSAASVLLENIYRQALAAVHPRALLAAPPMLEQLVFGPHRLDARRIWLAGAGKASPAMAEVLAERLGKNLCGGLVIGPSATPPRGKIIFLEGSHPLPDQRSLHAGRAMVEFLGQIPRQDSCLFLLSGGASSLMELPKLGISLAQIVEVHRALLRCGAGIEEINRVRQGLSQIKGGGLLALLPACSLTLILSDVMDAPLEVVGSGPTLPALGGGRQVLERYALSEQLSWDPLPFLTEVANPRVAPPPCYVLADVHTLLEAAQRAAHNLDQRAGIYPQLLRGEARVAAQALAAYARSAGPGLTLAGGETTVVVRGNGQGGRCQELALAFALAAEGQPWTLLAAGSDGQDGPVPAAGAWVDGQTAARARQLGLEPEKSLENNDTFPCLQALGALLPAQPSQTNLNDLVILRT